MYLFSGNISFTKDFMPHRQIEKNNHKQWQPRQAHVNLNWFRPRNGSFWNTKLTPRGVFALDSHLFSFCSVENKQILSK